MFSVPVIAELTRRLEEIAYETKSSSFWQKWVTEPLPSSPWQAWWLLALVRFHSFQVGFADEMEDMLSISMGDLAMVGEFAHPSPKHGVMPEDEEVHYRFNGHGCLFKAGDGILDVTFLDGTADWISSKSFVKYVRTCRSLPFAFNQANALHPSGASALPTVHQLVEMGLLEIHPDRRNAFRIPFDYQKLMFAVIHLQWLWKHKAVQKAVAAAVGDWLMLQRLLSTSATTEVQLLARLSIEQRSKWLLERYQSQKRGKSCILYALDELRSPELPKLLRDLIQSDLHKIPSAAINIIDRRDDPSFCGDLRSLFERANSSEKSAHLPYLDKVIRYLARHGVSFHNSKMSQLPVGNHCKNFGIDPAEFQQRVYQNAHLVVSAINAARKYVESHSSAGDSTVLMHRGNSARIKMRAAAELLVLDKLLAASAESGDFEMVRELSSCQGLYARHMILNINADTALDEAASQDLKRLKGNQKGGGDEPIWSRCRKLAQSLFSELRATGKYSVNAALIETRTRIQQKRHRKDYLGPVPSLSCLRNHLS
jgi:hypothetical protein